MTFSKQIEDFNKKALSACDKTRRGIVLELFNSVIMDTPVDTGRARGNWQASLNESKNNPIERLGESAALAEVQNNLGKFGDTNYLTNNLPYIERLEDGYSTQAPVGMMKKNIARIRQLIEKKIRQNKV